MNQAEQMNAIGPVDDRSFRILVKITHRTIILSKSVAKPNKMIFPSVTALKVKSVRPHAIAS